MSKSPALNPRDSGDKKKQGTAKSRGGMTPAAGDLSRGEGIFCAPELEE